MHSRCRLAAIALAAIGAWLGATPVHAQYQRLGFVAAGPGGVDSDRWNGQFTAAAGFIARFDTPAGVYVAFRTPVAYSRFTGVDEPRNSGTMLESGIDAMAGYDTGLLGGYGWYGIHYLSQSGREIANTPGGVADLPIRHSGLGPSYGAGLQLHLAPRASLFGEWYRSAGFDAELLRMQGLRFGVMGVF